MTTRYKPSRAKRNTPSSGFTASEMRTLRGLKTPAGIQKFLDDLPYNLSYTARSPKKVLPIASRHVSKAEFLLQPHSA